MKKINYKEKGITLVALVITIIILLILAGITINLALGENGVITRAQFASGTWLNVSKEENAVLEGFEQQIGDLSNLVGTGGGVNPGAGGTGGGANPARASVSPPSSGSTYSEGQEVTFGGEQFFVLSDDGNQLKLIAKYCLNQAGTAQVNEVQDETGTARNFAGDYYGWYWNVEPGEYYFDAQTPEAIALANQYDSVPQNAVLTAIAYGNAKGVSGRLMTMEEAENINNLTSTMKSIIYGRWVGTDQPVSGYLNYWIGCVDTGARTVVG